MKSYSGKKITISITDASAGSPLGVSITGLPAGFIPDMIHLQAYLDRCIPKKKCVRTDDGTTGELTFEISSTDDRKLTYDPIRSIPQFSYTDSKTAQDEDSNTVVSAKEYFSSHTAVPVFIAGGLALQILEIRGISISSESLSAGLPGEVSEEVEALTALGVLDDILSSESEPAENESDGRTSDDSSLAALRSEINETDAALLNLLDRRMNIARQIAATKRALDLPINDPAREAEILQDISRKAGPAFAPYAPEVFQKFFEISKDYQRKCFEKSVYGLIGHPLKHSFSREVHEALGEYSFDLLDLNPDEMKDFVMSRAFAGLTVTRPYKQDVIPLCDKLTPLAREIGAVNTLYFEGDELVGHNTDYDGFLYTAERSDISFRDMTVLILGTGGTSQTVARACSDEGALAICFASRGNGDGKYIVNYRDLHIIADQIDIIINTTPTGTYPDNLNSLIDLRQFTSCQAVIDVVYNPSRTALLMQAEELGMKTANGMPMIVAQAMVAAGRFMNKPGIYLNRTESILQKLESGMKNIILIGMPGSGKTTAGKKLAMATGRKFVDLDDEIVRESGLPIPEIFSRYGEEVFRQLETSVARRVGREHGQIIASGGGIVLSHDNYLALKQNGTFIWLTRPVEDLAMEGRPLSSDLTALKKMADIRYPLYKKWSDYVMSSNDFLNL